MIPATRALIDGPKENDVRHGSRDAAVLQHAESGINPMNPVRLDDFGAICAR